MKVIHLTHTDIRIDSRILKEMKYVNLLEHELLGIGVKSVETETDLNNSFSFKLIELWSKKIKFVPRIVRNILSLLELTFKFLILSISYRPKVIHCHDILVLPVGCLIKVICGDKLVYDAHELESDRNGISKIEGKLTKLVEKICWPFVNHLIVVSDSIGEWYCQNIGKKEFSVILNSPVVQDGNSFYSSYLREKFKIPIDYKIFIYIGGLMPGRGINLILETFFKKNINSHVVFLGYGELEYEIKIISQKCNRIHFHERVPHSEVVSVAQSADYGFCLIQNVSLSDYLCLPNKLFEYAFAGVKVIASRFPELEKTVGKYQLGECVELNVDALYELIKTIETSSENNSKLQLDIKDLSWQAQEEKLKRLYSSL